VLFIDASSLMPAQECRIKGQISRLACHGSKIMKGVCKRRKIKNYKSIGMQAMPAHL